WRRRAASAQVYEHLEVLMVEYHNRVGGYNSRENREFERWLLARGDSGLVVSCRSRRSGMLHRGRCWHFKFKPGEKVNLVRNRKICFDTERDYQAWERVRPNLTVSRCPDCKP